jgi:gluconokinase
VLRVKESYREILGQNDPDVKFVYLRGAFDLIARRLMERKGHFFDPALLRSQFEALESPEAAMVFNISNKPQEIISSILATIKPGDNKEEVRRKN